MKARPGPTHYTLYQKVTDELNRLETEGIIERVTHSECAAPIVPVMKTNGQVRLCGCFRTTVNMAKNTQTHPIPKIEYIYSTLSGVSVLVICTAQLHICSTHYIQIVESIPLATHQLVFLDILRFWSELFSI